MAPVKRIQAGRCCGALVDVQGFFLAQLSPPLRTRIKTNTVNFVRLLDYFRIPLVVTLERPVETKGALPKEIARHLGERARTFEKSYFDLSKEKIIAAHLARLKRRQVLVAGCETDVCVLQSCLGLIGLGYEVYLMEELVFSSSGNVDAALARLAAAGVTMLTYKMLYYELVEAVEGVRALDKRFAALGPFPDDLPDTAV